MPIGHVPALNCAIRNRCGEDVDIGVDEHVREAEDGSVAELAADAGCAVRAHPSEQYPRVPGRRGLRSGLRSSGLACMCVFASELSSWRSDHLHARAHPTLINQPVNESDHR